MNLYHIPPHKNSPDIVNAIIEIPKATNVKYEYDSENGVFAYDRDLLSAMNYPASYGFVPSTKADDGDALDIFLYNPKPIDRGVLVETKVIGVLDMDDGGFKDYKVLGVPIFSVRQYETLHDIDMYFLKICHNFFAHYKDLGEKPVNINGWHDAEFAKEIILKSYIA